MSSAGPERAAASSDVQTPRSGSFDLIGLSIDASPAAAPVSGGLLAFSPEAVAQSAPNPFEQPVANGGHGSLPFRYILYYIPVLLVADSEYRVR